VGTGSTHEPNNRITDVELYDGLVAKSQNRWPSLAFDVNAINNTFSRLIPSGFYYKTFMWPAKLWPQYEHIIRHAAGLGTAPEEADKSIYEQVHIHCDVLIAGAGIAGLAAAIAAAETGARVIITDLSPRFGGMADCIDGEIDGGGPLTWVQQAVDRLAKADNVHILTRTTVTGHYDHNWVLMCERLNDHLREAERLPNRPRHRLWKVRAKKVIAATGAFERPLTFANNDRPGVMLASAARGYVERFGVAPGTRAVIFTNNDDAYLTALALQRAGVSVPRIIDAREQAVSALTTRAQDAGIEIARGAVITNVETSFGGTAIEGVQIAAHTPAGRLAQPFTRIECDLVCMSGGWNPAVHLFAHVNGSVRFDDDLQSFRPDKTSEAIAAIGAANGNFDLGSTLAESFAAGFEAAKSATGKARPKKAVAPASRQEERASLEPLWFAPSTGKYNEGNKHFIDFQNDVTAADIELAAREGYRSVEHLKRYTTLGMATDQGKTSNISALGILADSLNTTIPVAGTTRFRPPFTPFSLGSIAGSQVKHLFAPVRRTAIADWHHDNHCDMEPVGLWRRPYCYPRDNEDRAAAINREILATRGSAGIIDLS
ncbi:MAG TPA: FAD-binding protein, partial [Rhizobiales bacterium]|nr:FAD-binding protein [Hyphomicrobiales bacterium]